MYELHTLTAGAWRTTWRFDCPELAALAVAILPTLARAAGAQACRVVEVA